MKRRLRIIVIILLFLPLPAFAGPKFLSEAEMDRITARGTEFDFTFNPDSGGLDFNFNAGSVTGNGSGASSPVTSTSHLALTGNNTLSNNTFVVDNMILNVNICAMCNATVINQLGLGLGITVNPIPPTTPANP